MSKREELHTVLIDLLGNSNVYYQPPQNTLMKYPCIRYSRDYVRKTSADDTAYLLKNRYQLIVISKTPDHPVIEKLLQRPMCSHDRHYYADNLHHDVLSIYY